MARWGMPSSQRALLDATQKRAKALEAKGKPVDCPELLRKEPDCGFWIAASARAHFERGPAAPSHVRLDP